MTYEQFQSAMTRMYLIYGDRLVVEWDETLQQSVIRRPADATEFEITAEDIGG